MATATSSATAIFAVLILLLSSVTTTTTTATTLPILHPFSSSPSLASTLFAVPSRRRSSVPIASGSAILSTTSYLVPASLGSPPQPLLLALDTSSDAALVPSSAFSASKSTTFRPIPRAPLNVSYASATFSASPSRDALSIAADRFPAFAFLLLSTPISGTAFPPQGILGLGRGDISLLSQTQATYHSTFSYCLPSFRSSNFTGSLRLGPKNQPIRIKTTPLLSNPHRPSFYYVSLTAIRVGRRVLPIPPSAFAFNSTTGAGTIFDSGTLFTRLVAPAYEAVRNEFRRRVGAGRTPTSLGGFDTCYDGVAAVPTVSFHFAGMNVTLPPENVVIRSTGGPRVCLAMAASPDNVNSVLNVIAGWQQQNHRVLVDIPAGRLGVSREQCTAPPAGA